MEEPDKYRDLAGDPSVVRPDQLLSAENMRKK
jgi:hypothetical protein